MGTNGSGAEVSIERSGGLAKRFLGRQNVGFYASPRDRKKTENMDCWRSPAKCVRGELRGKRTVKAMEPVTAVADSQNAVSALAPTCRIWRKVSRIPTRPNSFEGLNSEILAPKKTAITALRNAKKADLWGSAFRTGTVIREFQRDCSGGIAQLGGALMNSWAP